MSCFDSRRSLSSANRRLSNLPILFVSITQPCDQYDRKIRRIRKKTARWRGRRARGYRKLIFRANLLYVPNIKMQRRLRSRSVDNFGTCAWRTHAQWQNPRKKNVFRRRKNRILPLCMGFRSGRTEDVYRPRSQSPLHFDIRHIYKFTRKNIFLALGVCFPQPCSSAGSRFAASRSRLQTYQCIVSVEQQKFR